MLQLLVEWNDNNDQLQFENLELQNDGFEINVLVVL